jgi:hypothetical protein
MAAYAHRIVHFRDGSIAADTGILHDGTKKIFPRMNANERE